MREWATKEVVSCLDCWRSYHVQESGDLMETQASLCGRPNDLAGVDQKIAVRKSKLKSKKEGAV